MTATPPTTGARLGDYLLAAPLAEAGPGQVFRARDEIRGRDAVVRAVALDTLDDPQAAGRFERQAALAASLVHPHVAATYGAGRESGVLWIASELCEGESLRLRLERDGRLPLADLIDVGTQILAALEAAHERGLLHRRLRTGSVVVDPVGRAKVAGFGIDAGSAPAPVTRTDEIVGTVEYLAPELVLGDPVGPAADLYAAGVLLYELSTGRLPFTGSTPATLIYQQLNEAPPRPSSLRPDLPRALDRLLLRLLEKLPEERPPAAAARRALEDLGRRYDLADMPGAAAAETDGEAALRLHDFRPAFVGRAAEMAALTAHLAGVEDGGRIVYVGGEAGIGKTRLVEEFARSAGGRGARCLTGTCTFDDSLGPYMPLIDALGQLFRLGDEALEAPDRRALVDLLSAQGPELAALATTTTTAAKVRSGFAAAFGSDVGADAARLRFFDAVFEILATAARSRPLVLILEDMHWSDAGSLDLLAHLSHRVEEAPILLLVTYRPEELDGTLGELLTDSGARRCLDLDRLDRDSVLRLAESLFVDADLGDVFGDYLHGQSEGNPFIAIEVLKLLRNRKVLFCENGLWRVDPAFTGHVLPERVNALVLRRVGQLSSEERDVLQLAAVIGERFTTALLEAASGVGRIALLKLLFRLERQHRLIRADDGIYGFTHSKIREVLYAEIPWELRREYHRAVATLLAGPAADPGSGDIGRHLFRAESFADAIPHLEQAAADARRLFSWREAAVLYDQVAEACSKSGAEAARRLQALRESARCWANLTAFDEALQRLAQMQAVAITALRTTDEADAVVQMGCIDLRRGRFDDAVTAFEHAVTLVSDGASAQHRGVYGQALLNWGVAEFEGGRYAAAEERWQEARQLLDTDPVAASNCLNNLAVLATVRGQLDEAWQLYEQVLERDRAQGADDQMTLTYLNMSMLRTDAERWEEALELGDRSLDLCRRTRMQAHEPMIQLARAEALMGASSTTAAADALAAAQRGFRRLDDALGLADALRLQGRLCRQRQAWDEGRELLERSIELNRRFGESVSLAEALGELGELQRDAGQVEAALAPLREAEAIFERAGARLDLERVRRLLHEMHDN